MIVTPQRRILLSESEHGRLEILILGEPVAVAREHATILAHLEAWGGWMKVGTLVMGSQAIGLRADVSVAAHHLDPIAEWHRMCRANAKFLDHVAWRGLVGTW